MNIGIFSDTYFPQINGVATSALMLERELVKLGHNVYVFTTSDPKAKKSTQRVFRLPSMPLIFLKTHRLALFYSPRLIWKVKRLKLDIVHTQSEFPLGFFGKLISEIYRIPMVHTYHTMYEDYLYYVANGHLITPNMAKKFCRMFCNRADHVIAPVEKTRKYLSGIGVKRPISIIPTGLDYSLFDRRLYSAAEIERLRLELGILKSDYVIITVGRVAKEKSIDVLVSMMPKLLADVGNVKLLIVGDGPAREPLEAQSRALGVGSSVIFAGYRPWSEIAKYYFAADLFMTASTSETQGLTYIEAMASRIPVAVRRDPSFEDLIIHGETGFMFERNEDAAGAAAHVLTHPEEAGRVMERGFNKIQPYSAASFAKNVESVYMGLKAKCT